MDCKEVLGVREEQSSHSLSQSGAHPTWRVKMCWGSGKSGALIGPAVYQPATEGLQDVEILWGESLRA